MASCHNLEASSRDRSHSEPLHWERIRQFLYGGFDMALVVRFGGNTDVMLCAISLLRLGFLSLSQGFGWAFRSEALASLLIFFNFNVLLERKSRFDQFLWGACLELLNDDFIVIVELKDRCFDLQDSRSEDDHVVHDEAAMLFLGKVVQVKTSPIDVTEHKLRINQITDSLIWQTPNTVHLHAFSLDLGKLTTFCRWMKLISLWASGQFDFREDKLFLGLE